jgi:hypothetical protein
MDNMWQDPEATVPVLAKRVMVETEEGSLLFAKRVNNPLGGTRWIDDQSIPIKSAVVRWKDVVSGDATA